MSIGIKFKLFTLFIQLEIQVKRLIQGLNLEHGLNFSKKLYFSKKNALMNKLYNLRYVRSTFLFGLAILICSAVFSTVNLVSLEKHFFNSDTFYLPSIYQDLFRNQNNYSDFNYNPAPNFFPDMGVYFLLMKLFNGDFKWASFVFSILQVSVIFIVLKKIAAVLSVNKTLFFVGLGLLLLFFLPSIVNNDFLFTFYFLINSYHLGSFIMALLLMLLVYKGLSVFSWINLSSIVLLLTLSYVSDKSIVMNFSIPTLSALLLARLACKEERFAHFWSVFLAVLIGTFIGWLVLLLNSQFGWLQLEGTPISFDLEAVLNSITYFYTQTVNYLLEFSFVSLIVFIAILSYCSYLVLILKAQKYKIHFIDIYLFLTISFILFTPVLLGKITGLDSIRYNYHALILLVFIFPFLINRLFPFGESKYLNTITIVSFALALVFFGTRINSIGFSNYLNLYPQEVSSLDAAVNELGLKNGLATYWKAKKTTQFSKQNLKVYSIHDDLKVYRHVSNDTWYYDDVRNKGQRPVFNFFINDDDLLKAKVEALFSSVEVIILSETLTILKTSEFTFNEEYEIVKL